MLYSIFKRYNSIALDRQTACKRPFRSLSEAKGNPVNPASYPAPTDKITALGLHAAVLFQHHGQIPPSGNALWRLIEQPGVRHYSIKPGRMIWSYIIIMNALKKCTQRVQTSTKAEEKKVCHYIKQI